MMTLRRTGPYVGAALMLAAMLIPGCGDTGDDGDGGDATPVDPTYSSIQANIFTPTCATAGCHAGSNPSEGLSLEASTAYDAIYNQPSSELPTMDLIEPGDSETSYLWHKLKGTHTSVGGSGSKMPLIGSLSQDELDAIEQWIINGATAD